ncbi:uncharacterized protein STEHIDRAFT_161200 [Stereum hirsutum FP-91666 SS1]|uniref:uncharacterized protein n=1 Tax=Stereum hirsutum (strain FP-91666) TaxID=721885 RepID=UPI0004449FB7|nr:uncharacterized protein STEHIDRAFT_161200 [Stereum hirsutum FP-91666 SS1]EIM81847.1 hypothetical protein STEHIDRAFT_161200 [Stereum hirsutum FP-91666 SS1]
MPGRKNAKQSKEDELAPSQQSSSGSDDTMMIAFAQQMQVSAEKKRQAQDKKFMQTAEKDFVALLSARTGELVDFREEVLQQSERFRLEFAENEDAIRKIWVEILREQLGYTERASQYQSATIAMGGKRQADISKKLNEYEREAEGVPTATTLERWS